MLGLFGVALSKRRAEKKGRYAKTTPDGESLKKLVDSRLLIGFGTGYARYPLPAHELRVTSEGPTWRFAARFGACGGGEAGWTAAPRVQLPWDQLVFLEQFRGEEVLQAVDRAAVLEVAQEVDVLGIAGAPTAQELVAALQLSELGRLMAYPVPRSRGPRF